MPAPRSAKDRLLALLPWSRVRLVDRPAAVLRPASVTAHQRLSRERAEPVRDERRRNRPGVYAE